MKKPVFGQKIWVRTKGSKNCAKVWMATFPVDGEMQGEWLICPMRVGKPMTLVTGKTTIVDKSYWSPVKREENYMSILRKNEQVKKDRRIECYI